MSTYRIKEFAALTGVSVRALHHYDRLGLLKPHRARTGYRLYTPDHVAIVEQIVALRFVGIPLMSIGRLLRSDPREWDQVLDAQRRVLEEKRRRLDLAIQAIREAQGTRGREIDRVKRIIEVINMQEKRDEFKKTYEALPDDSPLLLIRAKANELSKCFLHDDYEPPVGPIFGRDQRKPCLDQFTCDRLGKHTMLISTVATGG